MRHSDIAGQQVHANGRSPPNLNFRHRSMMTPVTHNSIPTRGQSKISAHMPEAEHNTSVFNALQHDNSLADFTSIGRGGTRLQAHPASGHGHYHNLHMSESTGFAFSMGALNEDSVAQPTASEMHLPDAGNLQAAFVLPTRRGSDKLAVWPLGMPQHLETTAMWLGGKIIPADMPSHSKYSFFLGVVTLVGTMVFWLIACLQSCGGVFRAVSLKCSYWAFSWCRRYRTGEGKMIRLFPKEPCWQLPYAHKSRLLAARASKGLLDKTVLQLRRQGNNGQTQTCIRLDLPAKAEWTAPVLEFNTLSALQGVVFAPGSPSRCQSDFPYEFRPNTILHGSVKKLEHGENTDLIVELLAIAENSTEIVASIDSSLTVRILGDTFGLMFADENGQHTLATCAGNRVMEMRQKNSPRCFDLVALPDKQVFAVVQLCSCLKSLGQKRWSKQEITHIEITAHGGIEVTFSLLMALAHIYLINSGLVSGTSNQSAFGPPAIQKNERGSSN